MQPSPARVVRVPPGVRAAAARRAARRVRARGWRRRSLSRRVAGAMGCLGVDDGSCSMVVVGFVGLALIVVCIVGMIVVSVRKWCVPSQIPRASRGTVRCAFATPGAARLVECNARC